jgi:hypothetical protein
MSDPMHELIPKSTQDAVTFGLALLGAALGVINIWRAIDHDRVRLRLRVQGYVTSHGESGMCVEVVNLSSFAVTVSQVAFDMRGGKLIFFILPTTIMGGKCAPQRLESRASFTTHFPAGKEKCEGMVNVTRVFATTACGEKFTGTSVYLKSCIKAARAAHKGAAR